MRLEPSIAAIFLQEPVGLSAISHPDDVWAAVVDTEPKPTRLFRDDAHLDEALAGFGDAADLKSPFFQGHSRGAALLARTASAGVEGVDPAHPDAAWNHRNDDRLGGVTTGVDEIFGFLGESMELTAGSLRPVPENLLPDGDGHVAVIARISATRPDQHALHDTQILLFTLEPGEFAPWTSTSASRPP